MSYFIIYSVIVSILTFAVLIEFLHRKHDITGGTLFGITVLSLLPGVREAVLVFALAYVIVQKLDTYGILDKVYIKRKV